MKKLMIVALCATALMFSCKNKGKVEGPTKADTLAAVIDSIIEEADTTPMPMFLMNTDEEGYLQMLYWSNIEEPQKTEDNEQWFDVSHQTWTLQEMFRRNMADYTNLLADDDKVIKLKFVDEVLKDPDGKTPSIGERHGRYGIPSLCARFTYANPKDKPKEGLWGGSVIEDQAEWNKPTPLPDAVVKQLEKQYNMKVERMRLRATIGGRYIWGSLQFKGAYKDAPKDEYDPDRKSALALDVLVDSGKVYVHEELGYFDDQWGATWNADDDGEYVGCSLLEAFEGPKGLEICYERDAPESSAVGMFYLRGGQLIQHCYETYHNMVDEETPDQALCRRRSWRAQGYPFHKVDALLDTLWPRRSHLGTRQGRAERCLLLARRQWQVPSHRRRDITSETIEDAEGQHGLSVPLRCSRRSCHLYGDLCLQRG